MFAQGNGITGRVFVGERYRDGCNRCRCGKGGVARCQERACANKCYYKNWDWNYGWASNGAEVQAYDDKDGCPKMCRCKPTETIEQPIRTRYLGHVTGFQPIRDQYFLIWSVPDH
eukprot:sb/3476793/